MFRYTKNQNNQPRRNNRNITNIERMFQNNSRNQYHPRTTKRSKGLKKSKINQIQELEYKVKPASDQEKKCVICYENFKNRDKFKLLQCGHRFHAQCINSWLLQKDTCPLCLHSVNI